MAIRACWDLAGAELQRRANLVDRPDGLGFHARVLRFGGGASTIGAGSVDPNQKGPRAPSRAPHFDFKLTHFFFLAIRDSSMPQ